MTTWKQQPTHSEVATHGYDNYDYGVKKKQRARARESLDFRRAMNTSKLKQEKLKRNQSNSHLPASLLTDRRIQIQIINYE